MTKKIQDPWRRLLDTGHRPGGAPTGVSSIPVPPPGFLELLRAQRAGLWKIARALLWRKWSLLLALAALILFFATLFHNEFIDTSAPAIPRPATPFLKNP